VTNGRGGRGPSREEGARLVQTVNCATRSNQLERLKFWDIPLMGSTAWYPNRIRRMSCPTVMLVGCRVVIVGATRG
jgi:hypothetical protein